VSNTPIGLVISAVNGQRLYTNNKWPNPVVLKIEHVEYKPETMGKVKSSTIDGAK
jgi:alpha-L-fucosidase